MAEDTSIHKFIDGYLKKRAKTRVQNMSIVRYIILTDSFGKGKGSVLSDSHATKPTGMHGYTLVCYNPFKIPSSNSSLNLSHVSSVRYVDIAPTVLDLLDAEIPNTCEGESLLT